MNFEQLKSFTSIAKTGSFSQAAKERFVSQPTVSNQLRSLEKELGVTLMDRTATSVRLTEEGKKFQLYANQILELEQQAYQCFQESRENAKEREVLDIYAPCLQVDYQLPDFLVRAEREMRGREVLYRIVAKNDEEIPEFVMENQAVFGITSQVQKDASLVYDYAFTEEIVLITPNTEQYRNLDMKTFRDILVNDEYVRFDFGKGSDYLWNDFFGRTLGVWLHDVRTVARTSNHLVILNAVRHDMGISFVSNTVAAKEIREGSVLAYRCKDLLQKKFYLVYKKEKYEKSALMRKTRELLLEEIDKSIVHTAPPRG